MRSNNLSTYTVIPTLSTRVYRSNSNRLNVKSNRQRYSPWRRTRWSTSKGNLAVVITNEPPTFSGVGEAGFYIEAIFAGELIQPRIHRTVLCQLRELFMTSISNSVSSIR